jgi:hypothetical protein
LQAPLHLKNNAKFLRAPSFVLFLSYVSACL